LQAARDELSSVSAARDQAQALAAERNEEIEQLMAELRNARSIATDALVGKAKDQLAIEGKDAQWPTCAPRSSAMWPPPPPCPTPAAAEMEWWRRHRARQLRR
jgi:hypothetical protein